jgi:hypothetical protein
MILGEDLFDTSFAIQIDADLSIEEMAKELGLVSCAMGLKEARNRGRLAREYFDTIVRPYFQDPTLCFLNWLDRKGLRP